MPHDRNRKPYELRTCDMNVTGTLFRMRNILLCCCHDDSWYQLKHGLQLWAICLLREHHVNWSNKNQITVRPLKCAHTMHPQLLLPPNNQITVV